MSEANKFKNSSEQNMATKFPMAIKRYSIDQDDAAPSFVSMMAVSFREIDMDNVATLHAKEKIQWINVVYKFVMFSVTGVWRFWVFLTILYNYIVMSYFYIFSSLSNSLFITLQVTDVFFIADYIFALAIHSWKDVQIRMDNPPRSKIRLVVDGILALPLTFFYYIITHDKSSVTFLLLRLITFFRIYHIQLFFQEKSNSAGENRWKYFLLQYLFYFSMLAHTFACIWYLFACQVECDTESGWASQIDQANFFPENEFEWYIVSIYFAMGCITNAGFGDVVPTTSFEKIAACKFDRNLDL